MHLPLYGEVFYQLWHCFLYLGPSDVAGLFSDMLTFEDLLRVDDPLPFVEKVRFLAFGSSFSDSPGRELSP